MRICYEKKDLGLSFGFAVATMLFVQVLLGLIFGGQVVDGQMSDTVFWLMQGLYTLFIGLASAGYAIITKTEYAKATTLKSKTQWSHIGWGCLATLFLIALMLPVNEWLMTLIEKMGFARPSVEMPLNIVPMIFIACILPAFTEELLFRGTIAQSLAGSKNKWGAVAISGGLFALFHMNPAQTLHQFVLGALLTLLLFRSGSIWTTIAVHFFNNAVAVILTFTVPEEMLVADYGWILALVGAVGFALSVFGYIKTTKDFSTVREEDPTDDKNKSFSLICLIVSITVCAALWIMNLVTK